MIRQTTSAALPVFAALHLVVIAAPATVLAVVADKGGLPGAHGLDLLFASVIIGGAHALIVWRRLHNELHRGVEFLNASIAAFNALTVLALLVTGLLYLILGGFAPEHAAIVNQGWKVIWLWIGILLLAIAASELVRTAVLRWLTPERQDERQD